MEPGKEYKNLKGSWSSAFQAFQDRQVDVYVVGGVPPFPQMGQLIATSTLRLLGPTQAKVDTQSDEQLAPARVPGRKLEAIDPSVHGDGVVNPEPVYTYSASVGVIARADLDEGTVYDVNKAFWESVEVEREATPWLKHVTAEYGVQNGGLALHPGALRYCEEAGLEISDESRMASN